MLFHNRFIFTWLALASLLVTSAEVCAQVPDRRLSIAVLRFGESAIAERSAEHLATNLRNDSAVSILDQDQVRAAALGAGYNGSINLSLVEARELGAVLGSDFFVLGDAQTLRRSPSAGPVYFESYASLFLVSARTGRLIAWQRPMFEAPTAAAAEASLLERLANKETRAELVKSIKSAHERERGERELSLNHGVPVIEEAPDDDKVAEAEGLRLPRPFRRLTPPYPESAAKAEAEATVDVLVDLDDEGEVTRVEVARWAGFGLDEATVDTVRRLHFFPAKRNGVSVPLRVLLRYNFRKPPPQ